VKASRAASAERSRGWKWAKPWIETDEHLRALKVARSPALLPREISARRFAAHPYSAVGANAVRAVPLVRVERLA
jgi:hypothetical protein